MLASLPLRSAITKTDAAYMWWQLIPLKVSDISFDDTLSMLHSVWLSNLGRYPTSKIRYVTFIYLR